MLYYVFHAVVIRCVSIFFYFDFFAPHCRLEASKLCLRPVANFGLQLTSNGNKGEIGEEEAEDKVRVFHFDDKEKKEERKQKEEEANTEEQLEARRLDFFNNKLKLIYKE